MLGEIISKNLFIRYLLDDMQKCFIEYVKYKFQGLPPQYLGY